MTINPNDINKPGLALFDFDGTITRCDTLPLFIRYASDSPTSLCLGSLRALPHLTKYALKLIDNQCAKEKLLASFFQGWTKQALELAGSNFTQKIIGKIIRPQAYVKIKWHLEQGHKLIVISASAEEWVKPWADTLKISCLGTKLEYIDNKFSGRFDGLNCHGHEKICRLKNYLNDDLSKYYIYAYGDSRGDDDMLNIADEPFYKPFR